MDIIRLSLNLLMGGVPEDLTPIPKLSLELDGNQIEEFLKLFCERKDWMSGAIKVKDWMSGAIKAYGCSSFLCHPPPPEMASPISRATNESNHVLQLYKIRCGAILWINEEL